MAHLSLDECAINSVLLHEVVRRAVFNDSARLQNEDAIEMSQGRQSMRNGNDRASVHQVCQCALNRFFGFTVESRRRFVKQQQRSAF